MQKNWFYVVLGILAVLILVLGTLIAIRMVGKNSSKLSPEYKISIDQILMDQASDPAGADLKYMGKVVQINAMIKNLGFSGPKKATLIVIGMVGNDENQTISCYFEGKENMAILRAWTNDKPVEVIGKISGKDEFGKYVMKPCRALPQTASSPDSTSVSVEIPMGEPVQRLALPTSSAALPVLFDEVRIREYPSLNGKIIETVNTGVILTWNPGPEAISGNSTQVVLGDVNYTAKWYKVKTPEGNLGWIYGAAVGLYDSID